ncbi:MAG: hypothetical protein ABJH72_03930 [Reichenbachiella sp.]|uniref:hypothetical protein n=1 Tax=Reichenbachiella sp. TaxID=2184521 RepID=UPI003297E465
MKKHKVDRWDYPEFVIDHWESVGYDLLLLVFQQAEKYLAETVKSGEGITEKAFKVLGFSITILTVSLGYVFVSENQNELLQLSSVFAILLCILSIVFLIKPIWSYKTYVSGSSPSYLLRNEQLVTGFSESKDQARNLLLSECVEYQERINYNIRTNFSRSKFVHFAIISLILIPFTLILSWLFTGG